MTILVGVGAFLFAITIYFSFFNKQVIEEEEEEQAEEQTEPTEEKSKAPQGKSFKKLKQQNPTKKGKKAGSGPDPNHSAFLAGLKGMNSTIVDADFFETNQFLFVLVGEADSRISAYAVEHGSKSLKYYTQSLKLDGGQKVASVSLCQPKGTENDQIQKFFVGVACWDQCKI